MRSYVGLSPNHAGKKGSIFRKEVGKMKLLHSFALLSLLGMCVFGIVAQGVQAENYSSQIPYYGGTKISTPRSYPVLTGYYGGTTTTTFPGNYSQIIVPGPWIPWPLPTVKTIPLQPAAYGYYYKNPTIIRIPEAPGEYAVITSDSRLGTPRRFLHPLSHGHLIAPTLSTSPPVLVVPQPWYPYSIRPTMSSIGVRRQSLVPGISDAKLHRIITKPRR
jgi:hypothetical protein